MQTLLSHLQEFGRLQPALKKYLKSVIKTSHHRKGDFLVRPDDIAKRIYFIEKGLIRGYHLEENTEKTSYFMAESDVIISVRSFLTQTSAKEYIQCMEDCTLHSISFDQLHYAYTKYPSFNLHRADLLQKYYLLSVERDEMRQMPTYDRYCFLMEKQTHLVARTLDKYLASYLNIAKSTFSRHKRKYAKKPPKKPDGPKRC